ncbi:phage tail tape measure protein [Enterobacter mori]|uniref:phage tail tape measure protein n=1 Tax=Enterobacter mori TaxID=539813 RepID=UPI003B83D9FB
MKVSLTVTATDQASKVLQKGLKDTEKTASETQEAIARTGKTQQKINDENARNARAAERETRRNNLARERLGIRTEQEIQREIKRTTDAYKGLARAGFASAREQERALRATKTQLRELNQEMRGYSRLQEAQRMGSNALSVTGGVAAAGAVLAQPVVQQMTYERTLSHMSNTAFDNNGQAGRLAGREKLATSIRGAVTYGGGTKEDAATAMNQMLSSGTDFETANKWLPDIMRYATASGSSPAELAAVAVSAKKSFGIKDEDIPALLNMSIAAGKAGSFELKDLAAFLPNQMAVAGAAGMKGLDDYAALLGLNETAAITAGNSSEAGNNVVNLLAKINSKEAATAAAGVDLGGYGIDLPNTLVNAREKGINPIEAFNGVIDKVVGSNPRYQELQKKLATTQDGGERAAIMESMASILEGSAIGEIIADRQALMALLGYRNNPEYRQKVEKEVNDQRTLPAGKRTGDEDFDFIATTNDYKVEQAKNTRDFAQMDSVKGLADAAGSASEAVSYMGKEFPALTTAVAGAEVAIKAMTAAAITFAGLKFLSGGGKGDGAGGGGDGSESDTVTDLSAAAENEGRGWLRKGGALASVVLAFYDPVDNVASKVAGPEKKKWMDDHGLFLASDWSLHISREDMNQREKELALKAAEAQQNGAKHALPSVEQVIPGGASAAGDGSASGPRNTVAPFPASGNVVLPPINVTTELILDGHTLARVVNEANIFDASRGTGGTN